MPSIDLTPVAIPPPTSLREVRTSRMKKFGPVTSGIDKELQNGQLKVSKYGLPDDEHDPTFHGGIDKAIHQYCSDHYTFWQDRYPDDEAIQSRFAPGGFGENLVANTLSESNICIGDLIRIGPPSSELTGGNNGCVLEVSLPRQPCFKLNQRFGIKNFAPQTHQQNKTGWYYRVKEEGIISAGMEIRVVQRHHPKWSIARLHHYVHRDKKDMDVTKELMDIAVMGDECRDVFISRWKKETEKADAKNQPVGRAFTVLSKTIETSRIVRLELQALHPSNLTSNSNADGDISEPAPIPYNSYAVLLLPNGLKRPYSIVSGHTDRFTLGVALDDSSRRGGSTYIHKTLRSGDNLTVNTIGRSTLPNGMASHSIFIIGGIGITAFLMLMARMRETNQTFEVHYAVRTKEDIAFKPLLDGFGTGKREEKVECVRIYDKSQGERMDIEKIIKERLWNSHVYTCGPQRMIDAVIEAGKKVGLSEDEVRFEVFGANSGGDPFSVDVESGSIDGQGGDKYKKIEVAGDNTLLEALREAGLDIASSCETGNCGTCRVKVKCGRVEHRGTGLTKQEQDAGEMLSCVSRGIGHITIEMPEM